MARYTLGFAELNRIFSGESFLAIVNNTLVSTGSGAAMLVVTGFLAFDVVFTIRALQRSPNQKAPP